MTSRVQTLRSSTTGNVPAAGTQAPGTVWANFPDLQLGVIDASKNAQRLVAVRYFSTTANYAVGDFVVQGGVLYVAKVAVTAGGFNATQWTKVAAATDAGGPYLPIAGGTLTGALVLAADPGAALGAATKQYVDGKVSAAPYLPLAGGTLTGLVTLSGPPTIPLHAATKAYVDSGAFVPLAGGTMTGPLILNANPSANLGAVPKQYVDALPAAMNDNRIINGDMRIDQHNGGGTATGVYTIDRWSFGASQAAKLNWGRGASSLAGFPYQFQFASTSAYAVVAGDYFVFQQNIEADMVSDFAWGTSNAQPVTLSFWAQASLTGTFGGSVQNYANNRSYPFSFSLPTASTWTKIVITIPGDTGGTWALSGSGGSLILSFSLGMGSTHNGPANAWASVNYLSVSGAVSVVGTNGANFGVTGVKLEIGSVATPYNRQSLAKSMADCQRYYQATGALVLSGWGNAGSTIAAAFPTLVYMRATPTVTFTGIGYTNATALTNSSAYQSNFNCTALVQNVGAGIATFQALLSAEL